MKLLLVSDLHYGLRQYDFVVDLAPHFDAVVIAGDLLDLRSPVPIAAQAVAAAAQIALIGSRGVVLACSGNHDLNELDGAGEKAARWLQGARGPGVHVDGDTLLVGETLFTVCPWWEGPAGRAQIAARLAEDAARDREHWVWVHHAPPTDSALSWDGRREYGDEVLAGWIAEFSPDFVLSGHIHQAPFTPDGGWAEKRNGTWLFNPGREPGPVPPHIVLDLAAGQATWFSSEGPESVSL